MHSIVLNKEPGEIELQQQERTWTALLFITIVSGEDTASDDCLTTIEHCSCRAKATFPLFDIRLEDNL